MRLIIAAVGRLKDGPERDLYSRYADRIDAGGRSLGLGPLRLVELPESRAGSVAERKSDEAARLGKAIAGAQARIVLDEGGRQLASEPFARDLARRRDDGIDTLAFVIGGPDGHGPEMLSTATLKLSLGTMTLPHGLARILLAEQVYRATTILSGHPYHRA